MGATTDQSSTYSNNRVVGVRAVNSPLVKNQTTFQYDDNNRVLTVARDLNAFSDNAIKSQVLYDPAGRMTEERQFESASQYTAVQKVYDALGRIYKVSNPFRPGDAVVWTETVFDGVGRIIESKLPGGAYSYTFYDGTRALGNDQAGKERLADTNALGQIKGVWEIKSQDTDTVAVSFPNHPEVAHGYKTSYNYDVMGNLTKVLQGLQPRDFEYEGASTLP